jgi:hypothetical protein
VDSSFDASHIIDTSSVTKSIVNHVQTSLARQAYNVDKFGVYQATALAARDDLIVRIVVLTFGIIFSFSIGTRSIGTRLSYTLHVRHRSELIIFRWSF